MLYRIFFLLVLGLCQQGLAQPFTYFPMNFPSVGIGGSGSVHDFTVDHLGRKYIYGAIYHEARPGNSFYAMIRLNSDYTIDTTFKIQGPRDIYHVNTFQNYFVVQTLNRLIKVDQNGADIQPNYFSNMHSNHPALEFFISTYSPAYGDGRILVSSDFPVFSADSSELYFLHRILPDGRRDSTFNVSTDNGVIRAEMMSDSSVYVSGIFTTYNGIYRPSFVKVDTSGIMDTSFNVNVTFGRVFPLYKYPNGKLLVRGDFFIGGHPKPLVFARLNTDGSLDSSFKILDWDSLTNTWIITVLPLADGGFLCGGRIDSYDGYPAKNILKIDSLGNIDTTAFPSGTGVTHNQTTPFVSSIRRISASQYLVMGQFNTFNGIYSPAMVMLQQNPVSIQTTENNSFTAHPYPNPSNGIFSIDANIEVKLGGVYNQQGQHVYLFKSNSIDLRHLPNGLYFYKIFNSKGQVARGKLLKIEN